MRILLPTALLLTLAAPAYAEDKAQPLPPSRPPAQQEQPKIDPNASITVTVSDLQVLNALAAQQGKLEGMVAQAKPVLDKIQAQATARPADVAK